MGRHLWVRDCFCVSSGTVTDEVIKEYIERQDTPRYDGFDIADDAQELCRLQPIENSIEDLLKETPLRYAIIGHKGAVIHFHFR